MKLGKNGHFLQWGSEERSSVVSHREQLFVQSGIRTRKQSKGKEMQKKLIILNMQYKGK